VTSATTSPRQSRSTSRAAKAVAHASVCHHEISDVYESRQWNLICRNAVLHLEFAWSLVLNMLVEQEDLLLL